MMRLAILSVLSAVMCGCAGSDGPRVAGPASRAQQAALFDRVAALKGTWVGKDDKGAEHVSAVFAVTSGGSAVREIMLPGTDHEMTNVYHMDGPTLVMTHYCAIGNQPRMRATSGSPNSIDFKFDSITNLHAAGDMYMGAMKLTFIDADHIRTDWTSYQDGKAMPHTTFELARKK